MSDYRLSYMMGCRAGYARVCILLIIFAFLFSRPIVHAQVAPQPKPAALVEEQDYAFAYGLFKDALYQLAEEQLNKFLQKYPASLKRMDALLLRGECFFHTDQFDKALRAFEDFLNEYPRSRLSDDAQFRLGETYLKLKQPKEAIDQFKVILDKFNTSELAGQPDRSLAGEAAYWIGEAYWKLDDQVNALKYYGLAFEGYRNNRLRDYAAYSSGWVHQKKGNYNAAIEWYRRVVNEFPTSDLAASAKVRIGECQFQAKEYQQAIRTLTEAKETITSPEELGEAEFLIGESYYNLKDYPKAREQYAHFLSRFANHKLRRDAMYALGWTYMHEKDYTKATEQFSQVTGNDYLAHAALYRKGVAEQLSGDAQTALTTFREVHKLDPRGEYADNALFDAGVLLYDGKKIAESRELLEQVVRDYAASDIAADAYRMLGECLLEESRLDEARQAFEKSLTLANPSFDTKVNANFKLGWVLFKLKKYAQASAVLSDFVSTYPQHPLAIEGQFWLAESEYQLGNLANARINYEKIANLRSHEKKEEALYGAAWSYYKMNEFGKAITAFERLLSAYPNGKFVFDARVRIADCSFFLKEYRKAINNYRLVVRSNPNHESLDYVYYQLAQASYRAGDQDEAIAQFSNLLKFFPNSDLADDAQYAIGWIWFQSKEYGEAIKQFEKVITSFPASELAARAHYSIGDSYYNLKQYQRAERTYREVLRNYPNSPHVADAITGIQYCLTAQGKSQEALRVIDDFVRQNPDAAVGQSLYLRKGDLLFSQKEYDKAIQEYQSFITKYPRSPLVSTALHSIGRAHQEMGRLMEAALSYSRAASADGAPPRVVAQSLYDAGTIYLQQKLYDNALRAFERIENEHHTSEFRPDASYLKGQIFLENGDLSEAKSQFEFVRSRYGNTIAGAKATLSIIRLHILAKEFEKAQQLCQQVATSRTDELGAEGQYLSGVVYAEQKDWNNAITAFLRVRYIFPSHQTWLAKSYLGLGGAYEQVNDNRRAKEAYEQVIKLDRGGDEIAEAQRRLKNLERL